MDTHERNTVELSTWYFLTGRSAVRYSKFHQLW